MKAVLISIKPNWCELIASGKKTVEVRKTKPQLAPPFKVYIYCTKAYDTLFGKGKPKKLCVGGGRVIGEFVCDRVIGTCPWRLKGETGFCAKRTEEETLLPDMACLTLEEIEQYAESRGRGIYGWHISNLVIYDKPRELVEFEKPWKEWIDACGVWHDIRPCQCGKPCEHALFDDGENAEICGIDYDGENCPYIKITRPPQSWCYVEELQNNND